MDVFIKAGKRGCQHCYEKAKDKMMTWLIDWDWTTNQHSIGAAFGAKVCTEKITDDDMEKRACHQFDTHQELFCHLNYGQLQDSLFFSRHG